MSTFTCQHCNFCANSRDLFPHSENVCKNCMRDRPIAWKTIVYILARQNNSFPAELKTKPAKRAKATHVLHNLANPPAKQLMANIKFDTVLFREWTRKKLELQQNKGGQCAYTDACLDHMLDWMSEKKAAGNLVIHESEIAYVAGMKSCRHGRALHPIHRVRWFRSVLLHLSQAAGK